MINENEQLRYFSAEEVWEMLCIQETHDIFRSIGEYDYGKFVGGHSYVFFSCFSDDTCCEFEWRNREEFLYDMREEKFYLEI